MTNSPLHPALTLAEQSQSLIDRLLGLHELSWSTQSSSIGMDHALPSWVWVIIVLGAVGVGVLAYRRLPGSRFWRITLATLRSAIILVLAILLAGPTLILARESIEQDRLLVMLDRSASMQVKDIIDQATGKPVSRNGQMLDALRHQADVFSNKALGKDRRIVWLGFDASSYPIDSPIGPSALSKPEARSTLIRTSIEQALRLPAGKPISAIVLFSDGKTTQDTGPDLVTRLQQAGVPVFAVPIGADKPPADLAITQVDAPPRAFVNDIAPVSVTVNQLGGNPIDPAQIRVSLIDLADNRLLDKTTLDKAPPGEPVKLSGKSERVGTSRWQVRVEQVPTDGRPPIRELVTDNNTRTVEIEVIDRPIRALYVEGYPRWEFRYLKNLLIREKSVSVSTFLLSADRTFAQEGDRPITHLPDTAEQWQPYDVIIIGDVPASTFSSEQFTQLRDQVSVGGAGLMWIAGSSAAPQRYAATPLADLLPMRRPGDVSRFGTSADGFELMPTPLARALNVLQFQGPTDDANQIVNLPPLRWVQDPGPLKPTAETLAEFVSVSDPALRVPGIIRMRYGAGQSLYLGTDESWRWRYGRGDWYFQQYWVPLIRLLGRARVQSDTQQARLTVPRHPVQLGQSIVIELTVTDPALINRGLPRIDVTARPAGDPDADRGERITLLPTDPAQNNSHNGPRLATYRAVWRPTRTGDLLITVTDPALADLGLMQALRVFAPDDETADPRTDHPRLKALAEQTGGALIPPDALDRLIKQVPNRARITQTDIREPLWDSALSLIVLGVLLSLEWIVRRIIRLA